MNTTNRQSVAKHNLQEGEIFDLVTENGVIEVIVGESHNGHKPWLTNTATGEGVRTIARNTILEIVDGSRD